MTAANILAEWVADPDIRKEKSWKIA